MGADWKQRSPAQEILFLREQLKAAKRLVGEMVRKLHHEVPAYYISAKDGGLEFKAGSIANGKRERPEPHHRFMSNDIMDLAHDLKRKVNEL